MKKFTVFFVAAFLSSFACAQNSIEELESKAQLADSGMMASAAVAGINYYLSVKNAVGVNNTLFSLQNDMLSIKEGEELIKRKGSSFFNVKAETAYLNELADQHEKIGNTKKAIAIRGASANAALFKAKSNRNFVVTAISLGATAGSAWTRGRYNIEKLELEFKQQDRDKFNSRIGSR